MDDNYCTTWHMTRRLPVSVANAAAALDDLARGDRIELGRDRASLSAALVPVARDSVSGPVRRLRGQLRDTRFSAPVELEIAPWSRREAELAIRPGRARPPSSRASRYFTAGAVLLDELRDRLLPIAEDRERLAAVRIAS